MRSNKTVTFFQVFGRLVLNEGDISPLSSDAVSTELENEGEMSERTRDIDLKEHMVP